MDIFIFILKVLVASLLVSIVIKYLAPFLSFVPSSSTALIAVLLPSIVVAIVLLSRMKSFTQ